MKALKRRHVRTGDKGRVGADAGAEVGRLPLPRHGPRPPGREFKRGKGPSEEEVK